MPTLKEQQEQIDALMSMVSQLIEGQAKVAASPKTRSKKTKTAVKPAIKPIPKDSEQDTVVKFAKALVKKTGETVKVETEKNFVWMYFDGKPEAEVRQSLKDSGFFFNPKRTGWGHTCGYKKTYTK
jgi:hypothetical protein